MVSPSLTPTTRPVKSAPRRHGRSVAWGVRSRNILRCDAIMAGLPQPIVAAARRLKLDISSHSISKLIYNPRSDPPSNGVQIVER